MYMKKENTIMVIPHGTGPLVLKKIIIIWETALNAKDLLYTDIQDVVFKFMVILSSTC